MSKILSIPIEQIIVNREGRQRRELSDIEDLAASIEARGLFHPIIIDKSNQLVAGERRLEAMKHLGWKKALCRRFEDLDPIESQLIELEENIKRVSLPWQDRVRTVYRIVKLLRGEDPSTTFETMAKRIAMHYTDFVRMYHLAEEVERGNENLLSAASWRSAYSHVARKFEREIESEMEGILSKPKAPAQAQTKLEPGTPTQQEDAEEGGDELDSELELSPTQILPSTVPGIYQGNFAEWAPAYNGQRFNFIHCDFPYGIEHQDSDQGRSVLWGAYEDSADTYWQLVNVLTSERDNFMANSCHILFWIAPKFIERTLSIFREEMPEVEWWPAPLIWHKTDNRGIVPDHTRGPRHVYETALLGRRNDRKILKVVSDCYGAPTGRKAHLSEKPEPMLRHFFSMLVDDNTRILDPTCGSGSALRAADSLNAEFCFGLELDHSFAEEANRQFLSASGLRKITEAQK